MGLNSTEVVASCCFKSLIAIRHKTEQHTFETDQSELFWVLKQPKIWQLMQIMNWTFLSFSKIIG